MKKYLAVLLAAICLIFCACEKNPPAADESTVSTKAAEFKVPKYSGEPYAEVNSNKPTFTDAEKKKGKKSFETYSKLDSLGRCGTAFASVGVDIMPTKKRGSISEVKPTGWNQKNYAFLKDGHLYERCHLIAHQLTGEDANKRNLITGTRYMNVKGMLPFEEKVGNYVRSSKRHVLYRVTPIFEGENLLASGVLMEAYSVEDNGKGISFNVFCYNVQPGVAITYANGHSKASGKITARSSTSAPKSSAITSKKETFILNVKSLKFHLPTCDSVRDMKDENKREICATKEKMISKGYSPCQNCLG